MNSKFSKNVQTALKLTNQSFAEDGKGPKGGKLATIRISNRFNIGITLLAGRKKKSFLQRIVISDERWIYYDNPRRKSHGLLHENDTQQYRNGILVAMKLCYACSRISKV